MFVYKRIQMAFLLLFSCIILAACSEQNKPDATAKEEDRRGKDKRGRADATVTEDSCCFAGAGGDDSPGAWKIAGAAYGT